MSKKCVPLEVVASAIAALPLTYNGQCRWSGATILSITYDINVENHGNPYFVMSEKVSRASIELMAAGCRLVDILPIGAFCVMIIPVHLFETWSIVKYLPVWFPGASFKREAERIRAYADRMRDDPLDFAIKRMVRRAMPLVDPGFQRCSLNTLTEYWLPRSLCREVLV